MKWAGIWVIYPDDSLAFDSDNCFCLFLSFCKAMGIKLQWQVLLYFFGREMLQTRAFKETPSSHLTFKGNGTSLAASEVPASFLRVYLLPSACCCLSQNQLLELAIAQHCEKRCVIVCLSQARVTEILCAQLLLCSDCGEGMSRPRAGESLSQSSYREDFSPAFQNGTDLIEWGKDKPRH